jgi:hypothetical protein
MDTILTPEGFARKGLIWNRGGGPYIDVVDLQLSKFDRKVTVNLGVLDRNVYRQCWGEDPPEFAREEDCVVRTRLGILLEKHDIWWSLDDETGMAKMLSAVEQIGLEFLSTMHSESSMEEFLLSSCGAQPRYPPEAIYAAIIRLNQGKTTDGCNMLNQLLSSTSVEWKRRIQGIVEQHCK